MLYRSCALAKAHGTGCDGDEAINTSIGSENRVFLAFAVIQKCEG